MAKPSETILVAQGQRIREAVRRSGKRLSEVCRELGIGQNTMNRWVRGQNSARARFPDLSISTGVSVEWLERGDGPILSERADVIENFIAGVGASLATPITPQEAAYLRAWPHHRVTEGKLLDVLTDARRGLTAEDLARSAAATSAAAKRGAALGVPRRKG